jgi:hypothetical protein
MNKYSILNTINWDGGVTHWYSSCLVCERSSTKQGGRKERRNIINYLSGKGVETGCDNINASWTDSLNKQKKIN